jgi:hypothetical protein
MAEHLEQLHLTERSDRKPVLLIVHQDLLQREDLSRALAHALGDDTESTLSKLLFHDLVFVDPGGTAETSLRWVGHPGWWCSGQRHVVCLSVVRVLAQWCCIVLATVARVRGVARLKVVVGVLSHKGISEVGSDVMISQRRVKEVCVARRFEIGSATGDNAVIDIVFLPASNRSMTPFLDLEIPCTLATGSAEQADYSLTSMPSM